MIGRILTGSFLRETRGFQTKMRMNQVTGVRKALTLLGHKRAAPFGWNICWMRGDVERQDLSTRVKQSGLLWGKNGSHIQNGGRAVFSATVR